MSMPWGGSGGKDGEWEEELRKDIEVLKEAARREAKRSRKLRAMDVEDVQALMQKHADGFAAVIHARKALLGLLVGKGEKGSVGGGDTRNYVVRHRQEGHVDEKLVTAYEALWIKTYGSGAGYIGDPNALVPTGAGGNQMKMADSSERVYRGVAKGGKGNGSRRSIIKDEMAFNFKRKIDKRLRRMASEIDEYMRSEKVRGVEVMSGDGGVGGAGEIPRCVDCRKFVERDWRFCASCGARCANVVRRDDVRGACKDL